MLAVDPSSVRTGGSILADKTRMAQLPPTPAPSSGLRLRPARSAVRGAHPRNMPLCEAAGHDLILVETVGTGQSETAVADMTDFFLALMLPGAGDELQGLKGMIELADMVAVNKADGDNVRRAQRAAAEYRAALHILTPRCADWQPPFVTYSAVTGAGLPALWEQIVEHERRLGATGARAARRHEQQVKWMWTMLEDRLRTRLYADRRLKRGWGNWSKR